MSPPQLPAYDFNDFQHACESKRPRKVFIWSDAVADADTYFNLRTEPQILDFIVNGGLESLRFINQRPLETSHDPSNPEIVDAYGFKSGHKDGYIAFYRGKTGNWIIKSFHPNQPLNTMEDALRISGLIP